MNRRTAIATLLTAAPGMVMASDIKWSTLTTLAAKTLMTVSPDGTITVNLDSLRCLRVTMGGDSIDVSAAEIFEALKPPQPFTGPDWSTRMTITDRPVEVKP